MILKASEDNKIIIEQIEKSFYVRFYNITSRNSDETRRYLDTNTLAIGRYNLDIWNFDVPNYQDGHVYVRIVYDGVIDSLTDDQLLKKQRNK